MVIIHYFLFLIQKEEEMIQTIHAEIDCKYYYIPTYKLQEGENQMGMKIFILGFINVFVY